MGDTLTLAVDEFWSDGWRGPTLFALSAGLLHPLDTVGSTAADITPDITLPGTLFAHLTDHHTHLGLVDPTSLVADGITDVIDLGWIPAHLAALAAASADPASHLPRISFAGRLLTCPRGYPARSGWAPEGSWRVVRSEADAEAAVGEQVALGASIIKATLNSDAGPTLGDRDIRAIVGAAHAAGLPVAVHAQGRGQVQRAFAAGADQLAHAPFSEPLDEALVAAMAAAGMAWVSTLDIHGWGAPTHAQAVAVDNVRRFAAHGGRILYGTDLGNGPLPVGVNGRELLALARAGLGRDDLVRSIAGARSAAPLGPVVAWIPGTPPDDARSTAEWLSRARGTTVEQIQLAPHPEEHTR